MGKKLYVGNLPFQATEAQLQEAFSVMGEVASVKIITDKYSGTSKGFGFVEMATEEGAAAAVEKLNGSTLSGRKITVQEAKPSERK